MKELSKEFKIAESDSSRFSYPAIMKRNARYRGQRESEKHLNDHQEQIYDIRKNWVAIDHHTDLQEMTINSWFVGEFEATKHNNMIKSEKSFQVTDGALSYPLITDREVRCFEDVVVKLDGVLVNPTKYTISDRNLEIDIKKATSNPNPSTLWVSYSAYFEITGAFIHGVYSLTEKLQRIDQRLREAEGTYNLYENAYK